MTLRGNVLLRSRLFPADAFGGGEERRQIALELVRHRHGRSFVGGKPLDGDRKT